MGTSSRQAPEPWRCACAVIVEKTVLRVKAAGQETLKTGLRDFRWAVSSCSALNAGWSSLVARQAHNLKAAGSNPAPATNFFGFKPRPFWPKVFEACRGRLKA